MQHNFPFVWIQLVEGGEHEPNDTNILKKFQTLLELGLIRPVAAPLQSWVIALVALDNHKLTRLQLRSPPPVARLPLT